MTRFKSLFQAKTTSAGPGGQGIFPWPASYSAPGIAQLSADQWSLNTSGCIEKPTRFLHRNIQAMPQTVQERRWISADGWSIKARWKGILLEELVKRIHPQAPNGGPIWVIQENTRGEQECILLDELLSGQALLCHQVNDEPIPWLYGGPVSLMVFDRYSYKGLGQVTSLTFTDIPLAMTHHEQKGYPADGAIAPGDYYAFDLQAFRPLHGPELWGQEVS